MNDELAPEFRSHADASAEAGILVHAGAGDHICSNNSQISVIAVLRVDSAGTRQLTLSWLPEGGADGGTRTRTTVKSLDFKSNASTSSATSAVYACNFRPPTCTNSATPVT